MITILIESINRKGLILVLLFLCSSSLWAYDFSAENDNGVTIYYNIIDEENKYVSVTYEGDTQPSSSSDASYSGDVTIPETVEYNNQTYTVTEIGEYAFAYCTSVTSVTLPTTGNLTSIGDYAFYGCTGYTSSIPSSVESIGNYAFSNTGITSITIPSTVTSIGTNVFQNCSSLASVTFSDVSQITSISNYTFYGCTSLTSIEIPSDVKSIGNYAFYGCSSISLTSLPDGITSIGNYAFYDCTGLTSDIPSSVTTIGDYAFFNTGIISVEIPSSLTSIGIGAFADCSSLTAFTINNETEDVKTDYFSVSDGVLYNEDGSILICYPANKTSNTTLDNVTSIGDYAFYGCTSFKSDIPSSVTSIGNYAFFNTGITSVKIPSSLTSIGTGAFANCSSLTAFSLASSSEYFSIGDYSELLSADGTELICYPAGNTDTDYTTPDDVTEIGDCAFYGCTSLETITISSNVTTIGDYAFKDCTNLDSLIYNAKDCTDFGDKVFDGCTNLTELTIGQPVEVISSGLSQLTYLTTMYYNAANAAQPSGYSSNSVFRKCEYFATLTIGTTAKTLPDYVFSYCNIINLTFNDGLETIGVYAFNECTSLKSFTFPNTLIKIGEKAFQYCYALESVTIPYNVTKVGQQAFEGCRPALKKATVEGNPDTYTQLKSYIFAGCSALEELTLGKDDLQTVGEGTTYGKIKVQNGLCTNENSGHTSGDDVYCESLKTLTIGKGVLELSANDFNGCHGLKTINYNAIDCILVNGYDPDGDETLLPTTSEYTVFENCYSVETLNIGDEVTQIPDYIFTAYYDTDDDKNYYYTNPFFGKLTTVDFPASVTKIGNNAFYGCAGLKTLTFDGNIKKIGDRAFCLCDALDTVTIGECVDSIGVRAFYRCNKLTTVYEKRSLEQLRGDYNSEHDYAPDLPIAGDSCFLKVDPNCFLVVPEDAARFYTAPDGDGSTESDYLGYGAISPTAVDENGDPTEDEGWATIPYLREDVVTIEILTTEGYATHYSPYSYTLNSNYKYGVITGVDSKTGDLNIKWDTSDDHIVPAGSAILIKGEKGTAYSNETMNTTYTTTNNSYSKDYVYDTSLPSIMYGTVNMYYNETGSKLKNGVTDVPTDNEYSASNYSFYKLSYYTNKYGVKELGFYKQDDDGSPFSINGDTENHKYDSGVKLAWLAVPKEDDEQSGSGVRAFYPLDENSTGIETIEASYPNGDMQGLGTGNDAIYNLQGMKVKEITKKGIYIVNGKKMVCQ